MIQTFLAILICVQYSSHLVKAVEGSGEKAAIKCKYVLVEKSYYGKLASDVNSSWLYQKHFNLGISGRVEFLKSHLFKFHVDDCLNTAILDRIDVVNNLFKSNTDSIDNRQFSLFGIDMSSNDMSDAEFESILNTNPITRYNLNLIKYLNLANNKLRRLTSNSNQFSDELDEFNFLNDGSSSYLRPNQTGYLLGRFSNLESLLLDDNSQLTVSIVDLVNVLPRLRVISASRCGGASSSRQTQIREQSRNLIYIGLSGNKITDHSIHECFPDQSPRLNIDYLDLSFNKISNFSSLLTRFNRINRLNLEKNLIEIVRVKDMAGKFLAEVNLRSNFIQNTSLENFRTEDGSISRPAGIRLAGNPLICDCRSIWLLDLIREASFVPIQPVHTSRGAQLLNRKRPKSTLSDVKLVVRRDMEVISYHNIDQDPNFSTFMQRQKRLNLTKTDNLAKFLDLDQLTCNFIDVQDNTGNQKRAHIQPMNVDNQSQIASDIDMSSFYDYYLVDSDGSNTWEIRQKLNMGAIRYREKLLTQSSHQDFMCQYEDHCRADKDCDCCVFQHCHCRSICPSKCRCYFDSSLSQNIIDCSQSNLIDVPSDQPIESATDMRLNSNSLKMLKAYSFFGYGSIRYLYLQDNQISALNRNAFDDLKSTLRVVNLANNRIEYLHGEEFLAFTELEIIVLTNNPIRQFETLGFLSTSSLPKLKLVYASRTHISPNHMSKIVGFMSTHSNASIKYKERRMGPLTTTLLNRIGVVPEYSIMNSTNKRRPSQVSANTYNETIQEPSPRPPASPLSFLPLNGLTNNIYFITISIIVVCLFLSLMILAVVLCIVRRIEKGRGRRKNSQVIKTQLPASYFTPVDDQSDPSSSSEDDAESSCSRSRRSRRRRGFKMCICKRSSSFDSSSSSYFDSTSSSNATNNTATDAASVPVSRCLEYTCLYVYIYYSIADSDYATNYLLSCLQKCLTIVPDTRFIMRPQNEKYAWGGDDSQTATNTSGGESSSSAGATMRATNPRRHLTARVLVISENFYGLRLNTESCLTGSSSSDRSLITSKLYSRTNNSRHNIFRVHLFNMGTLGLQQHANPGQVVATTTNTSSRLNSFNKRVMKRLLDTSTVSSNRGARNLATININNDSFSSFAFSEQLQSKLEKFLEHVCIKKSHTFSKTTNFSYVDYTKR